MLKSKWPGNIRELKSCLEYLVSRFNRQINAMDIPMRFYRDFKSDCSDVDLKLIACRKKDHKKAIEEYEQLLIETSLFKNRGYLNKTARYMGMSKTTLIAKVRKYGLVLEKIKDDCKKGDNINNEF